MTVLTDVSSVIYSGNGVTTAFPTTFPFIDAADLVVTEIVIATSVETVLVISTDYTVTGGEMEVGTVTLTAGALPTTKRIRIDRQTDVDQPTDFQPTGEFPIATLERQMDRLTLVQQEQVRDLDAKADEDYVDDAVAVVQAEVDALEADIATAEAAATAAAASASAAAISAAAIEAAITAGGLSGAPVSAAMEPVVVAATLADARTAMGVPGLATNQTWTGNQTFNTGTVTMSNGATVAGTLAGAAATFSTTLGVTGAITGSNTATITGLVTANAGLTVAGGAINSAAEVDVASATTTNLSTAASNKVRITGTTTITGITLADGRWRLVRFAGALTLTHGSFLVLPGAANITTAAGDTAVIVGEPSSVVRVMAYQKADGTAIAGATGGYSEVETQYFTANGTWTKPSSGVWAAALAVGGGGSGARQANAATQADGGGGGQSILYVFKLSDLSATEAVTIGAGGAARTGSDQLGDPGGQTSFGTRLTAKGGAGGGAALNGTDTVAGTGTTAVADPGLTLAVNAAAVGAMRPMVLPAGLPIIAKRALEDTTNSGTSTYPADESIVWEGQTPGAWGLVHPFVAHMIPRAANGAAKPATTGGVVAGETSPSLYSVGGSSSAYNTGSGTAGTGYGAGGGGGYTASGAGTDGYVKVWVFR